MCGITHVVYLYKIFREICCGICATNNTAKAWVNCIMFCFRILYGAFWSRMQSNISCHIHEIITLQYAGFRSITFNPVMQYIENRNKIGKLRLDKKLLRCKRYLIYNIWPKDKVSFSVQYHTKVRLLLQQFFTKRSMHFGDTEYWY